MTGSMAMVSMYTMQGHDEVIIRTKGGPSKQQIKTKPQFEKVRRNNNEWSACTKMGGQIRRSFYLMHRLEDYLITGTLNAICKQIQKLDEQSEHGQRNILLSKHKEMLTGLSFSKKQVLESVLRVAITYNIDRTNGTACIEIPAINTDIALYNFRNLPFFRIVASLSAVHDIQYNGQEKRYNSSPYNYADTVNGVYESPWLSTTGTQAASSIKLQYPMIENPIPDDVSLILCLGIEFGKNGYGNSIEPVKYSGTGKILLTR